MTLNLQHLFSVFLQITRVSNISFLVLISSSTKHIANYHYFFFAIDPNIQRIIDTTISVRICNFLIQRILLHSKPVILWHSHIDWVFFGWYQVICTILREVLFQTNYVYICISSGTVYSICFLHDCFLLHKHFLLWFDFSFSDVLFTHISAI